jgi:hypothetical protein
VRRYQPRVHQDEVLPRFVYILCLSINATSLLPTDVGELPTDVGERQTPDSLSESTRLTSIPGTGYPDRRFFVLLSLSM